MFSLFQRLLQIWYLNLRWAANYVTTALTCGEFNPADCWFISEFHLHWLPHKCDTMDARKERDEMVLSLSIVSVWGTSEWFLFKFGHLGVIQYSRGKWMRSFGNRVARKPEIGYIRCWCMYSECWSALVARRSCPCRASEDFISITNHHVWMRKWASSCWNEEELT